MPCIPCQEECSWGCEHRQCKKRCNELCDIAPCSEPCKKMLECNHPCVGFCGDPCPPLCRICDKEELTEIFFGNEDEPDARFVLLEDCSHCVENKGLMGWLEQFEDSVQVKTCPKCRTPIKKCMRIMNQIKKDLQDVLHVKGKIFYENIKKDLLTSRQKEYMQTLKNMLENPITADFSGLYRVISNLMEHGKPVKHQKKQILSAQEIEAFRIIIDILNQIFTVLTSIKKPTVNSYQLVKTQVTMLAQSLPTEFCITQQEILDFHLEVGRLSCMAEMCKVDAEKINDGFMFMDKQRKFDVVIWKLEKIERFDSKREREVRSAIMKLRNLQEDITREREMIVKAVGLGQGHWFKCPNGHYYAIGECGGAMQTSKCPECGAKIGGQSHRLLGDNALASEMDGASRQAWPGGLH